MSKYELQRHKRSDKIKWIVTGIALVLLFVMVTGLCLQLFGTGKVKPSEWFKKADNEQTEELPEGGADETAAVSSVTPLSAVKFLSATSENDSGISTQSEDDGYIPYYDRSFGFGKYEYVLSGFACYNSLVHISGDENDRQISSAISCLGMEDQDLSSPSPPLFDVAIRISIQEVKRICNLDSDFRVVCVTTDAMAGVSSVFWAQYKDYIVGSGFHNMAFSSNPHSVQLYIELEKTPVPLPADPVKEGYTFVGWYYDSDFTRPYAGEAIYADTALYAKFEINRYTVTFNSDGGSAVASQTVDWNTAAMLSTPTRDKYAFKGWYLPNGTQYTNQPIKADTTLTAHWERNVFTVTFETDGGSAVESQEVNLNASVTLPTTTRTGYVFKGWYLSDGTEYTDQGITADITLTAHWEVQTFTVTFYVDGEVYETMTVDYGTPLVPAASEFNLNVMSVTSESGAPSIDEEGSVVVKENCSVEAVKMNTVDQTINTVNQNKWAIIGGVAGGVALIAVVAAICGGVKHKRKR